MPATPPTVAKAKLYSVKDRSVFVEVHFNPTSLVYSVENATPQQGGDPKARQFAGQFTGKLTMDLQFDTTGTGDDVRIDTNKVANFLQPAGSTQPPGGTQDPPATGNKPDPAKAQPVVSFEWGSYSFQGVMESFRETIDFFSAEGVPLRAMVSIGLARQDQVLAADLTGSTSSHVNGSLIPTGEGGSPQKLASLGGDPSAARQLASANGLVSTRFTAGASLQVDAGVQLKPAAGFAVSASASGGLGLNLGASAGAGFSAGISGGAGVSLGGGFSAGASSNAGFSARVSMASAGPVFGSSASAGVPATMGAFAGLETGRAQVSTTAQLDPMRMLRATAGASVATFPGASFSLGGAANNASGAGLSADVGSNFSFSRRLTFDSDD
jgi:hypothetical protein